MDPRFFSSPFDLRAWLIEHHQTATELWVGYYKKGTGRPSITWPESVDEALCFGWIDGVRKRLDDSSYVIRFTPRRPRSIWSAVNIQRAQALTDLGLMHPAGLKAFAERDGARSRVYAYEQQHARIDGPLEEHFRANTAAWAFFQAQAPSYQRTAAWWVVNAKREETRQSRLAALIAHSEQGRRLPQLTPARRP